jgi:hypothetical protein
MPKMSSAAPDPRASKPAGEREVRIIDHNLLEIVEQHGCKVELQDG